MMAVVGMCGRFTINFGKTNINWNKYDIKFLDKLGVLTPEWIKSLTLVDIYREMDEIMNDFTLNAEKQGFCGEDFEYMKFLIEHNFKHQGKYNWNVLINYELKRKLNLLLECCKYRFLEWSSLYSLDNTSYHMLHCHLDKYRKKELKRRKKEMEEEAARTIQKHCYDWLWKPVTSDGNYGITVKLGMKGCGLG